MRAGRVAFAAFAWKGCGSCVFVALAGLGWTWGFGGEGAGRGWLWNIWVFGKGGGKRG